MLGRIQLWIIAFLIGAVGLWLTIGGIWLMGLGGTVLYVPIGLGCILSAILLYRRKKTGAIVYFALLLALAIWAGVEAGTDFWLLLPRLIGPAVIGLWLAMPWVWAELSGASVNRPLTLGLRLTAGFALPLLLVAALMLGGKDYSLQPLADGTRTAVAGDAHDWPVVGRSAAGTRYSPATQITPENVAQLEPVWNYRTGDLPENYPNSRVAQMFEATPIKIDDTLYLCSPRNIVIALDAVTGGERWRHDPKVDTKGVPMAICRGVTFYEAPVGSTEQCPRRIMVATVDARMIALDAATGKRCQSFGVNGEISLRTGLGEIAAGYYYVTSPPTIIGDVAVVGGLVLDNMAIDEPSGVVRGFDARTGKLRWAWDAGALEHKDAGAEEQFVRGSPNAWSLFSVDPQLGLVYIPTGNSTPDHFGGHRNALTDRYSASVVALDGASGRLRWSFQSVHHDLWDYDVASQPVLLDMPIGGATVPALLQPTKQGDIFLLDRRSGKPLLPVTERPVPAGDIPGERYSPTQPSISGAMSFMPPPLVEADMWGITPIDQLWCRIQFRRLNYQGRFTPISTKPTLVFPGNNGIMNWGSVSVDEARKVMIVNSSYMPLVAHLIPRKAAPPGQNIVLKGKAAISPMAGTPYAVQTERPFTSFLGIPCNAPPWGKLTAVDLKTQKLLWQRPLGTTSDHAPLGVPVPGVFNQGGSVVTAGGVVFVAAAMDNYLRAFDLHNGKELWKGRLPAGAQATPMTYVSRRNGRQYVVIASGGHQFMQTRIGDYVIAFALPEK